MSCEASQSFDSTGKNKQNNVLCSWSTPIKFAACYSHIEFVEALLDRLQEMGLIDDVNNTDVDDSRLLVLAYRNDHIEYIKCKLEVGWSEENNGKDDLRTIAFMLAARGDPFGCAVCLLDAGLVVGINIMNDDFSSKELLFAASKGQIESVHCLNSVELGGEDDDPCPTIQAHLFGESAFLRASMNGNAQCVKYLLDSGLVDAHKETGTLPKGFFLAAKNGHVECVKYLIEAGLVDVNVKDDSSGSTGLFLAARHGRVECVKYFLGTGLVDVSARDKDGATAIMAVADGGHVECLECLLDSGVMTAYDVNEADDSGKTALMLASRGGFHECVSRLLNTGLIDDINRKASTGETALMLAAFNGNIECVMCLLESGLVQDINATDNLGLNAFMLASISGQEESVKYFLATGMALDVINVEDYYGHTAFSLACKHGNVECVKCLLNTVSIDDVDKENHVGSTALMLAAESGHHECVECLLRTGLVDINKVNKAGRTALMLAANNGHIECVDLLLNTGLVDDINKEDVDGSTAIMLATNWGHVEIVKRLLDTGKEVNLCIRDCGGKTALQHAITERGTECLRCIFDIVVTDEFPTNPDIAVTDEFPTNPDIAVTDEFPTNPDIPVTDEFPGSPRIAVTSDLTPGENDEQEVRSKSRHGSMPKYSETYFTYSPGITWKSPYVHDRDQPGQCILKLVVGRGLNRCVVCFLLGDLDVPATQPFGCHHEGLLRSATDVVYKTEESVLRLALFTLHGGIIDYALQYERIRSHFLVILFRQELAKTGQISLDLYKRLICLVSDSDQVDCLLDLVCDGSHMGRCVDFLMSAIICRKDRFGFSTLMMAEILRNWNHVETLLEHIRIQDCQSLSDSVMDAFVKPPNLNSNIMVNERLFAYLKNGIFHWSWYPHFSPRPRDLAHALVMNGYSPGEFEWQGVSSSPLHHAFTTGDEGLARYLVANLYLTSRDVDHHFMDTELRNQVLRHDSESLRRFHRQVFGSPWSLRELSFVKVSTHLRCKVRREDMTPVDTLPIPRVLKRQLSFANDIAMVDDSFSLQNS